MKAKDYLPKDYLHLYLGCQVQTPLRRYPNPRSKSVKTIGTLLDIDWSIDTVWVHFEGTATADMENFAFADIKLLLRPLSDIKPEEEIEEVAVSYKMPGDDKTKRMQCSRAILFLLSKRFDLFNLIDKGLALDINTVDIATVNAEV